MRPLAVAGGGRQRHTRVPRLAGGEDEGELRLAAGRREELLPELRPQGAGGLRRHQRPEAEVREVRVAGVRPVRLQVAVQEPAHAAVVVAPPRGHEEGELLLLLGRDHVVQAGLRGRPHQPPLLLGREPSALREARVRGAAEQGPAQR